MARNSVCSFERSMINAPGPCVLFATPGMISGGFSLEVFKHWAPYEENLITLPGYLSMKCFQYLKACLIFCCLYIYNKHSSSFDVHMYVCVNFF